MRKIRAFLLETAQEPCPKEVIHGDASALLSLGQREQEAGEESCSLCSGTLASSVPLAQENAEERPGIARPDAEEEARDALQGTATGSGDQSVIVPDGEPSQAHQAPSLSRGSKGPRKRRISKTIERAIQDYLQDQRSHNRRLKTVEWHQTALGLFQQYLLTECHRTLLSDITEMDRGGWCSWVSRRPPEARSERLVPWHRTCARLGPFVGGPCVTPFWSVLPLRIFPYCKENPLSFSFLSQRNENVCFWHADLQRQTDVLTERATARNQAILWVLADTGMRASEVCGLHLEDVNREQGILTVRGKASKQRCLTLGARGAACCALVSGAVSSSVGSVCGEGRGLRGTPVSLRSVSSPHKEWDRLVVCSTEKTGWDHEEERWRFSVARYLCGAVSASRRGSVPVAGTAGSRRERRSETVSANE